MQKVDKHEYELVSKDRSDLWDQLCEMMRAQKWVSQDLATTTLLREMENVLSLFIVRKSDNLLLGATVLVETEDLVFGNVYIMRDGFRASGMGMLMVKTFQKILHESFKKKPFIARGVESMLAKYSGLPFLAEHHYGLYRFFLKNREAALNLFEPNTVPDLKIVDVQDLNPRQFQQLVDYDRMVTGVNRTTFLQHYYSLDIVKGVVLYDKRGEIKGMAGIVPTPVEPNLYKLNPIYAFTIDYAAILVKEITKRAPSDSQFVCFVRNESAGDVILQKCKEKKIPVERVNVLVNATNTNVRYKDPVKTEFMYAPNHCDAHFDS